MNMTMFVIDALINLGTIGFAVAALLMFRRARVAAREESRQPHRRFVFATLRDVRTDELSQMTVTIDYDDVASRGTWFLDLSSVHPLRVEHTRLIDAPPTHPVNSSPEDKRHEFSSNNNGN